MKKQQIITVLIFVVVVSLVVVLYFAGVEHATIVPSKDAPKADVIGPLDIIPGEEYSTKLVEGRKDDLETFSIAPNAEVSGKFLFQGIVKGGYFFEGNILVNILDSKKKLLRAGNAKAMGDWMTSGRVKFQGDIDFTGLTKGPAYIEIHNGNASGLKENDKSILVPVIIK